MIVFIDDILIYSRSLEGHARHLEVVLQVLWERKLFTKLKKCEFWLQKISFLGHVVTKEGISMDPTNVKVIMDWPRP